MLDILVSDSQDEPPSFVDAQLLDGAAVVHFLPTTNVVKFNEYADQIFLPHIAYWTHIFPTVSSNQLGRMREKDP